MLELASKAIGAKLDSAYPAVAESWAVPDEPYLEIAREETNIANARMLRLLPLLTAEITAVLVVIQMYAVAEKLQRSSLYAFCSVPIIDTK